MERGNTLKFYGLKKKPDPKFVVHSVRVALRWPGPCRYGIPVSKSYEHLCIGATKAAPAYKRAKKSLIKHRSSDSEEEEAIFRYEDDMILKEY